MIDTRHGGGSSPGISLIELLTVVAIIAILAAVTWPRLATLAPIYRLEGAARGLAAEVQRARSRAIAEGRCYQVSFDTGSRTYQVRWSADSSCASYPVANRDAAKPVDDAGTIGIDNGSGGSPASPVFQQGGSVSPASVVRLSNVAGAVRTIFVQSSGRVVVQ